MIKSSYLIGGPSLINIRQISVSTQFRGDTGPHTSILSNCQLHPEAPWSPMSYASSVAFDTCVFIFTVVKFRGNSDTFKSKVNRQIYNDSLLYFFLQTATNIVVLSIQTQSNPSFNLIKPATVPFSTLMTVTMGTRVFLNLRLFNRRQEQLNAPSLPVQVQYSGGANHPTPGFSPVVSPASDSPPTTLILYSSSLGSTALSSLLDSGP